MPRAEPRQQTAAVAAAAAATTATQHGEQACQLAQQARHVAEIYLSYDLLLAVLALAVFQAFGCIATAQGIVWAVPEVSADCLQALC